MSSAGSAAAEVPSFQAIQHRFERSESRLYDRHGVSIQELRTDLTVRHLGWTPLAEISPALQQAVVASEDRRFYSHAGVDWLAVGKAAGQRLLGHSRRGASTISMQVAAWIDPGFKPKGIRRNVSQKLTQIREALALEHEWTKPQILEAYLNLVSFRGELQGVASAARSLFGKAPSGLDPVESLLLAALIRSPEAAESKVLERACWLAQSLDPPQACEPLRQRVEAGGLLPKPFPPAAALAPHAARQLLKQGVDRSTLDARIQARVIEILRRQVLSLRERNMNDAAALVVDNSSGQVLAYVGSLGALSRSGAVDGVRARRQAGSTLKPFLYSLAIERKLLTASSRIDDSPTDIALGPGAVYRPQDFDHEYHGDDVTLRLALASSLNVPAVRTLQQVGVGRLVDRMKALGFEGLRDDEFYGPSLALGTADVTLWELVNAYRALANEGRWSEMTLSGASTPRSPSRQAVDAGAAFVVGDVLSDKTSRSLTFGLDSPLSLKFWAAVKTGTSKDMRDNWCVGYTSRYTVGVWAGNFSGEPMWNVTGVSGAAPAWAEILETLHSQGRDLAPKAPPGVVRVADEWYLRGTEPNLDLTQSKTAPIGARITYPVEGLTLARDPDIPADRQRVYFELSSAATAGARWILNGRALGPARREYAWALGPTGNYDLRLVSDQGLLLDEVRFVVR